MKMKLAAALLAVLVMASMATAYARVGWSYWVDYPDGSTELVDPADLLTVAGATASSATKAFRCTRCADWRRLRLRARL